MKKNYSSTPKKACMSNTGLFHHYSPHSQSLVSSTKLFSVPAIFSTTAATRPFPADKYDFIFFHHGRRHQAVLKKTFLTGLKKDNVRITWEEAVMYLTVGCEVKIDISRLGFGNWMVFGLYFYTNNAVMNPASKLSQEIESRIQAFDDNLSNERGVGDECRMVRIEDEQSSSDGRNQREIVKDLEEESSCLLATESLSIICDGEYERSVDGSLVKSDEFNQELTNISMIVHPDLADHHIELKSNNESIDLFREVVYADALLWRSGVGSDDAIDVIFDEVLASNGIFENLGNLADDFDELYDNYFTKTYGNRLKNDKDESEFKDSSWIYSTSTTKTKMSESNSVLSSPSLASTPAPKCDLESGSGMSNTSLSESESSEKVKKDSESGYFESFSSGDLTAECSTNANSEMTRTCQVSHDIIKLFFKQLLVFSVTLLIPEFNSVIF